MALAMALASVGMLSGRRVLPLREELREALSVGCACEALRRGGLVAAGRVVLHQRCARAGGTAR